MSDLADDGTPLSAGAAQSPTRPKPDWLVPAIIGSALLMQNFSATVIANALPAMAQALHVDPVAMNVAITSFLLAGAVFLPVSGWMADRYGARLVFLAAIAIFTLSSVVCGFAQSIEQLIAARVVQGAASAMLMPVGRLVLLRTVPKSQLVGALAIVTMPALFGPMLGPPVGGLIVTFGDWRWIFFLNAPIGLIGLLLAWRYVPDVREETRVPMDWIGFALAGVACAALVFGFENLGRGGLPLPIALAILLTGVLSAWLFALHARRVPNPILDPTILRYKTFSASVIGGAFMRLSIGATPFLLALLFQLGFGMSAFQAGLVTCTAAAGALAMKAVAPPLIRRFGFRTILIWNGFITTGFFLSYALFTPQMPVLLLVAILLVGGFFRSLQFTSLNGLAYAEIEHERMSPASTLSSMGQQLTQSVGVGLAAVLLNISMQVQHSARVDVAALAPVFVIIGLFSALGHIWFYRLSPEDGSEMSGAVSRRGAGAVRAAEED